MKKEAQMEVFLVIAGAAVIGSVAMLVGWLRSRWFSWRHPFTSDYMSESWMKDHVYRTGVRRDE